MALILGGKVFGRFNVLGLHAQFVLNRLVFIGTPSLIREKVSRTDVRCGFLSSLVVAGVSALATTGLYLLVAGAFWKRSGVDAVVGTMGASLVNAARG